MNTPVSFEISKLLKEKGFDIPQLYFYIDGDISWKVDNTRCRNQIEGEYAAPTIAEVVMWLYEKHGIWITVYTMEAWPNGNERKQLFDYSLKQMRFGLIDIPKKPEEFNSPTEAYSQAIEFTLKNLI